MNIENRTCPKCASPMAVGFPVESHGKGGMLLATGWSDALPALQRESFFGVVAERVAPRERPTRYLLGFSCVQCGFVELFAVGAEDLKGFLARFQSGTGRAPDT